MAIDWTAGMQQTYELVAMDADTWTEGREVNIFEDCTITRENSGLRVSVKATVGEELAEGYYRVYLLATQGDEAQRVALATFLATNCSEAMDGRRNAYAVTGYSPLYELDADMPPIGWTCSGLITTTVQQILSEHCRAPVSVETASTVTGVWTAGESETWLDVAESLLALASMHLEVDGEGRVHVRNDVDASQCLPVRTFGDDTGERSVLYSEVETETDRADVPNEVEVVLSTDDTCYTATATDDDPNSKTSTATRGYTVLYRETSPDLADTATLDDVQAYADSLLAELMRECVTASYSHGFVPDVDVGTCVALDYGRMGYSAKAIVTSQTISCVTGCTVDETAEYEAAA